MTDTHILMKNKEVDLFLHDDTET